MHASPLQGVVDYLRRLTDPTRSRDVSDAELLERFRLHREEAAFTLLVQRHGPLVLNLCRRILGDAHEAEDVFQATFLVLVRKADTLRNRQSLSAWLHRVAVRLALKARAQAARRQTCKGEDIASVLDEDGFDALAAAELRAAIHEEIERLPEQYRTPIILCYFTEKTHEQAAHELGWPKSSFTARLAKALQLLQQRLIRRGYTVPAGLAALLATETTTNAALPSSLALSTVRGVVHAQTGQTLRTAASVALADSLSKGTVGAKWTVALMLLATLGFAAAVGTRSLKIGASAKPIELPAKAQAEEPPHKPRLDWQGDPLPDGVLARMGSMRMRHFGVIRHRLAFSPDGKSLFSGGNGVRIWDAETGKLRRRLDVRRNWTLSFASTNEGMFVASGDFEKGIVTLQVFDPLSGKVRRRLEFPDRAVLVDVVLSHDGKRLAYGNQNEVRLHDTTSGREVLRLPAGCDLVFAPDGKTVVHCDNSDTIRIYDSTNGDCTLRLQHKGDYVARIAISPNGRYLASLSQNPSPEGQKPGELSIWDLRTGKELHRLKGASGNVLTAAFSPDGKYVAVGCQHPHLLLFELATGKEMRRFPTDAYFGAITFSPDGKQLAASSGIGTIRMWETATGRVSPASADPFLDSVHELHFTGNGQRLLGHSGIHFAWEPSTGQELRRFPHVSKDYYWPAALSPDESLLATAADDTIRLWDAKTGRTVRALKSNDRWIGRLVFAPDGRRLISSGSHDVLRVWDVTTGKEWRQIPCSNSTTALVVSPDSRWLAAAIGQLKLGKSYEVVFWDLATGQEKKRFSMLQNNSANQLAFSANGNLLAAVGGGRGIDNVGEVQVWDLTGNKQSRSLDGHKSRVFAVAFSPDNRSLATGDRNGDLFLWELASGLKRCHFLGHESTIKSLAFSPDGRSLAASSFDAPVYIWDVAGILEAKPGRLSNEELQRDWTALAGQDASAAFQAIRRFAASPEQTLPFLRQHLKPVPAPDRKRVRQWVEMLDSDAFATRQQATAELEKQADAAAALLRQILAQEKPSLEVRRRLQQIVKGIDGNQESLRAVRAVEIVEWIGTAEAVRLLEKWAQGAEGARLSREAVAAKRRLSP